jgi:translation elongation factor EF-4
MILMVYFPYLFQDKETLESAIKLYNSIGYQTNKQQIIILANKLDLVKDGKNEVDESKNELNVFQKENSILFEVSAKTGENVEKVFETILKQFIPPKTKKQILSELGIIFIFILF